MDNLDYEKDVKIDESALDIEWLQQSELTMKYCRIEAEARQKLDSAKLNLDIVKADLDKKIRNNPDKFDMPKVTESAISNVINAHDDYKDAEKLVNQANYDLNMAQSAVRSIYVKKDALENLVRLYGQQYFAGPKIPRNLSQEWLNKQSQKRSDKKVKLSRNN